LLPDIFPYLYQNAVAAGFRGPGPQHWGSAQRSSDLLAGLRGHFLAKRGKKGQNWRRWKETEATEGEGREGKMALKWWNAVASGIVG